MKGSRKRPKLTYANVVSTLALFLLLVGGTAFAATQVIRKNSVSSANVKDGSLTSADLEDGGAVTGAVVADGSLSGADLAAGSVGGAQIADGSVGAAKLAPGSITGAKLGKGAVGAEDLLPETVSSANVLDNSIRGVDVGQDAITGADINEATIERVGSTNTLRGRPASGYVSQKIYEVSGTLSGGVEVAMNIFEKTVSCRPGDLILGGGPIEVAATSHLVASFTEGNTWFARIRSAGDDSFQVNAICADQ
jgi:hypothetical protein